MADINKVVLVGRLTRDAELTYTQSGYALLKFSIAVNRRRKQGEEWVEEANFFDVTSFGRQGEAIAGFLSKGRQIAVEGQLRQDRWEAQDGSKRSKVYVDANYVQLLGSREGAPSGAPAQQRGGWNPAPSGPPPERAQQGSPDSPPASFEDDIPF